MSSDSRRDCENSSLSGKIAAAIAAAVARLGRPVSLMEVCGTHTMAIARHGLRGLLPKSLCLVSGPGCPVCVSEQEDIDRAVALARLPGVITASFGDMLKVPGSVMSLDGARASGADVRVVYSPADAVELAARERGKNVVFIAVGFETTAPAIAACVLAARRRGLDNFFILPLLKTVPPALRAVLSGENALDGFLLPGHVCAVSGLGPYGMLETEYRKPAVVSGFEPLEILHAVNRLCQKLLSGDCAVENAYPRAVRADGNPAARGMVGLVFEPADARWRAMGLLPRSGLALRAEFAGFDALKKFPVDIAPARQPEGCICGLVITGRASPARCPLMGSRCTPLDPAGPCMVSSEGACAAWYHYGDR